MAMALDAAGHDFTIFEKADDLGGTWRDNRYPGLTCDVPAVVYTYSTHRSVDWPRVLADGPEIHAYLARVFAEAGLAARTRFGAAVTEATWRGDRWQVTAGDGFVGDFDAIVHATGFLHHPAIPDIVGLDDFAGPAFHSSRWPTDLDVDALAGRTVGVIGTGSTGVQLTTALSRHGQVRLFQRTPQWIFPVPDLPVPSPLRRFLGARPGVTARMIELAERAGDWFLGGAARGATVPRALFTAACRANLARVRDRDLRRRLTPRHAPLCKRPVMSAAFYPAVASASVDLIDAGIERIVADGVVTDDGVHHDVDLLVLATGFDAHAYMRPMALTGIDGCRLDDAWSRGPSAYRTIAVHGFPNMFMMFGPHAPLLSVAIHNSAEREAAYIVQVLDRLAEGAGVGGAVGEPTVVGLHPSAEATAEWVGEMRDALVDSVWSGDCSSWYVDEDGLAIMWPHDRDDWFDLLATPCWDHFDEVVAPTGPTRTKG